MTRLIFLVFVGLHQPGTIPEALLKKAGFSKVEKRNYLRNRIEIWNGIEFRKGIELHSLFYRLCFVGAHRPKTVPQAWSKKARLSKVEIHHSFFKKKTDSNLKWNRIRERNRTWLVFPRFFLLLDHTSRRRCRRHDWRKLNLAKLKNNSLKKGNGYLFKMEWNPGEKQDLTHFFLVFFLLLDHTSRRRCRRRASTWTASWRCRRPRRWRATRSAWRWRPPTASTSSRARRAKSPSGGSTSSPCSRAPTSRYALREIVATAPSRFQALVTSLVQRFAPLASPFEVEPNLGLDADV